MNRFIFRTLIVMMLVLFAGALCVSANGNDITATMTIDNKINFEFGDLKKTVSIYGTDDIAEQGVLVASGVDTESGEYLYDFIAEGSTYYNHYIIMVDGSSESYTVDTQFFFPRISKEITNLTHPFVATTQADIDRTKELIKTDEFYKSKYDNYIILADKYADALLGLEELYPRGDGRNTTSISNASHCAAMWVLSDNPKYLQAARHFLLLVTDYLQDNEAIQTETKNDGWSVLPCATIYDLIYNGLNEVDRQVIENGALRKWVNTFSNISRGHMLNIGHNNEVNLIVGLVLKDQECVDRAINRENYGYKFLMLNSINDDGSQWNYPSMYFSGRVSDFFTMAEWMYRSGYDVFNYSLSGTRPTEWWSYSANYRDVENGDIAVVEAKYPLKESLDFAFNYVYADGMFPVLGDTKTGTYGLNDTFKEVFEIAYKHYDDTRVNYILSDWFGKLRNPGQAQPETQPRSRGSFTSALGMINAEPMLKGGEYIIGNEQFAAKGYNKLGNSMFLDYGQLIFRSLDNTAESVNTSIFWKNYYDPGHGHNDLMSVTLYGCGKELLKDMGSYAYGTNRQAGYAAETASHNLIMIDNKNYQNDGYEAPPSYVHRGIMENLAIGPYSKAVKCWSDRMYRNEPNWGTMTRTLWQIDDYVVDFYTAEMKGTHKFDYLLNLDVDALTETTLNATDMAGTEPLEAEGGLSFVRPYKKANTDALWSNTYSIADGGNFRMTMLGGEETDVYISKAITDADTYTAEKLVARRNADDKTTFISVFEPVDGDEAFRTITPIDVNLKGNKIDWAKAVQVVDSEKGNTDTIMYGYSYGNKEAGKLSSDGDTAFLRQDGMGDAILGGVGMKYISGEKVAMKFNTLTSAQLTRLGENIWRLDISDGKQTNGKVTLYGMPSGLKVFKGNLSGSMVLEEVDMYSYMNFPIEKNGIYIIAESEALALSIPQANVNMDKGQETTYNYDRILEISNIGGNTVDVLPEGEILEAEDFTSTVGGETIKFASYDNDSHSTNNPYGTGFYGWDKTGYEITWKFNVEKAGKYRIVLRYSTMATDGAMRSFSVNGQEPYVLSFSATDGWGIRESAYLKNIDGTYYECELNAGENTLVMDNISSALNLDCFSFVPVE